VIAEGIRDTELADYQRAVRTLIVHPLVTATSPDRAVLGLIRRFAPQLAVDLDTVAGYRLELKQSCARLIRRIDRLDGTQTVRRRDGKPFDRRRYAYLALVMAALSRAGSQVALTELADALRRRAAEIDGLGFDPDTYRHRLAFIDVVRQLLDLGALREVEVSTVDWVRDPDAGEALYDLDRDVLHLVVVPPRVIQHIRSAGALLTAVEATGRDARRAASRQRLGRLLLEYPVVYLDDLDDDARTYLVSQGRVLSDEVHRLTGGQVERRAEGIALVDATGGFSDRRFPAGGTASQVALLFADAMAGEAGGADLPTATIPLVADTDAATIGRLDVARPIGETVFTDPPSADGDASADVPATDRAPLADATAPDPSPPADVTAPATGPLFDDAWLVERAQILRDAHGRAFAADLRDDPTALAAAAVEVLATFDLVRPVPGGVVARPAIARYRDLVVQVKERPQPSLLDTADESDRAAPPARPDPSGPTAGDDQLAPSVALDDPSNPPDGPGDEGDR
jgi:uncharacterized protein (TIGR02678 family)